MRGQWGRWDKACRCDGQAHWDRRVRRPSPLFYAADCPCISQQASWSGRSVYRGNKECMHIHHLSTISYPANKFEHVGGRRFARFPIVIIHLLLDDKLGESIQEPESASQLWRHIQTDQHASGCWPKRLDAFLIRLQAKTKAAAAAGTVESSIIRTERRYMEPKLCQ